MEKKPREWEIYFNNTATGSIAPQTFINHDEKELDFNVKVVEKCAYEAALAEVAKQKQRAAIHKAISDASLDLSDQLTKAEAKVEKYEAALREIKDGPLTSFQDADRLMEQVRTVVTEALLDKEKEKQ